MLQESIDHSHSLRSLKNEGHQPRRAESGSIPSYIYVRVMTSPRRVGAGYKPVKGGLIGSQKGGRSATHLTLVLVQMMYSISSEYGFWKVKLLVRINIHSRFFMRNRYITDRTWPFNFTTWGREGEGEGGGEGEGKTDRGNNQTWSL